MVAAAGSMTFDACPNGYKIDHEKNSPTGSAVSIAGGSGSDRAFSLECWNGGTYVNDRVRRHHKPTRIVIRSLATIGGIVPDRLRQVPAGADDGLTARLLYIWPQAMPVAPLADRGDSGSDQRRTRLAEAAQRLRTLSTGRDLHGDWFRGSCASTRTRARCSKTCTAMR